MANDVFANGREISCKAGDGKSICAFPDVCFTPPENPATPPGVPIPYPNTGMASDTTSGSKTVKISGKEVMLKNKSYFKKSTGDEAGCAAKKGVITSVNKGKVYFNSWSMDVKFEGENVVRHLDMTTHNHMSPTPNTGPWPYADSMALGDLENTKHPCKKDMKKEREKCQNVEKKINAKVAKGEISKGSKNKALRDAYCGNKGCQKARKCMLVPYKPEKSEGQLGCCPGMTPHHVIPVHCFMGKGERDKPDPKKFDGCKNYDLDKAPCICVEGKSKTKTHGKIHKVFDKLEDDHLDPGDKRKAGSWTYAEAKEAAKDSCNKNQPGCDKKCTEAQVKAYHEDEAKIDPGTLLRADSTGHGTPDDFTPSVTVTEYQE
ncbi:MAG: PAAR-like domain-containing protein [Phycisphaerales bacterium]